MAAANDAAPAPLDWSFVLGGPLLQRLRVRLGGRADDLRLWRMVAVPLLAWLPLLLLALPGGSVVEAAGLPFLADLDAHTRLLGALPLLLGTEILVHRRMRAVLTRFVDDGLVGPADRSAFDAALMSAIRWRNSVPVEVTLLVLSLTLGHQVWLGQLRADTVAWYGTTTADGTELTPAGAWYAFVSLPMLRFLLFRWYYRLGIWYRLLWRVSRLPLEVCTLHADRAGGLGFVAGTMHAFTPFALAHSLPIAGLIATRILHGGASLVQFRVEVGVVLVALIALVLLPAAFFRGPLAAAKASFVRVNGHAVRRLDAETGGADHVARLADLDRIATANERMRTVLFTRGDLLRTAVVVALPLAPLVLTTLPVDEIFGRVFDVLF